jgi:predicted AAA+ superfamily ATPase
MGPVLEGFVAMEILRQAGWSVSRVRVHHYRSTGRREVDLILERPDGRLVGIEVKAATTVRERDLGGLLELKETCGERFHRGLVLHPGEAIVPLAPKIHSVPLAALWSWQ